MQAWLTKQLFVTATAVLVAAHFAEAADGWPCWRGPAGNNHSVVQNSPTHWTGEANVLWKAEVPGRGHASPCVSGDRIFLASADDAEQTQSLLCFDRRNGKLLWKTPLHHGPLPAIHANNSHASATPACDGELVVVPFVNADQLWVSGVNIDGTLRWQEKIGGFRHANGYGSSPALFGNLVIVVSDNQEDPALVALARTDGHVVWRVARPNSDNSATPVVAIIAGRPQLLLNGAKSAVSYDPATGNELWHVSHGCDVVANTMTFDDECVYASGNVPERMLMAIRADGQGDVTDTHVLWHLNRSNPYVPSPLVCGERLITVLDNGTVVCRQARTGEELWKRRLSGNFFSSPVLAGNHVYAVSELGVAYIFDAADKFELVAENDVGEACMATPAICGGKIYLRSLEHLYCIEAQETE